MVKGCLLLTVNYQRVVQEGIGVGIFELAAPILDSKNEAQMRRKDDKTESHP